VQFKSHQIADTATRIQKQTEYGSRPYVLPKFYLPQQAANLGTTQTFRCQHLSSELFDRLCWVGGYVSLGDQPTEEAPQSDEGSIDSGYPPMLVSVAVIAKIRHVPDCHSIHSKRFTIRLVEPSSEFADVIDDCLARVLGVIVSGQELVDEGRPILSDRNATENIIAWVLHALSPSI
jgi:hypothetical protein